MLILEDVFRGKLASASLKPCSIDCAPDLIACIPRQACLGLIEARITARTDCNVTTVFRGKLASASLKHLCYFDDTGPVVPGIPRQACLGLIEASNIRRNIHLRNGIPRQACLGLIEAP